MSKTRIFFLVISFSLFFFLIFFSLLLVFFFLSSSSNTTNSSKRDLKPYQVLEFDPTRNKTRTSLIKTNRIIKDDEFLSFQSQSSDNLIVITNLASSNYKCTGSCFCPTPTRRTARALSHGLFALISALTSTLALKIAENVFREQCRAQFSYEDCDDEDGANYQVDDCIYDNVDLFGDDSKKPTKEWEEKEVERANNHEFDEFYCSGHCVRNNRLATDEQKRAQEMFEESIGGTCKHITTSGEIYVQPHKDFMNGLNQNEDGVPLNLKDEKVLSARKEQTMKAKIEFNKALFRDYCAEISNILLGSDGFLEFEKHRNCMCVSTSREFSRYSNINCYYVTHGKQVDEAQRKQIDEFTEQLDEVEIGDEIWDELPSWYIDDLENEEETREMKELEELNNRM